MTQDSNAMKFTTDTYQPPYIAVAEIRVERGFAASLEGTGGNESFDYSEEQWDE